MISQWELGQATPTLGRALALAQVPGGAGGHAVDPRGLGTARRGPRRRWTMTRWLVAMTVSAAIFLVGFGLQYYLVGRRECRQRGIAVPGWPLISVLVAAMCHARWNQRHGEP